MSTDRDAAYVLDILAAAELIEQFLAGFDLSGFLDDERTQSAVVLQIVLIGETAKKLSPDFRKHLADIPWSEMARMRDLLIHHYEVRDLRVVWATARTEIPRLRTRLEPFRPPDPD